MPPRRRRITAAPTWVEQPEDTPDTPVAATRNPRAVAATRTLHSSPQVVRPEAVIRRRHSRSPRHSRPRAAAVMTGTRIFAGRLIPVANQASRYPAADSLFHPKRVGASRLRGMRHLFALPTASSFVRRIIGGGTVRGLAKASMRHTSRSAPCRSVVVLRGEDAEPVVGDGVDDAVG